MLRKIPIAICITALILGSLAVATKRGSDSDPSGGSARSVRGALVSTTIGPPEERARFWQARVDQNPGDYLSRTSLGSSLLAVAKATGDLAVYEQAEQTFRDALALNPQYASALLGLGAARAAQHDFQTQLGLAERVYAGDPKNESAHLTIADAKFELGQYGEAGQIYEELILQERSAPLISRLARSAWFRGEIQEALDLSVEAISATADLELPAEQAAGYFFQLGTFAYRAGHIDEAEAAVDRALEINPGDLGSLELIPRIRIAKGDAEGAIARYERLITLTPAADLHGELAKLYQETGRSDEAQHQVELGLELGREQARRYPAERRHLADFFGAHDPALALRLAEEDVATRQDVGAHDTLSWALYQNGRFAEAQQASNKALATGIQEVNVLFHAGMAEAALGHDEQARQLLSRALEINAEFDVANAPIARRALDAVS
jgi:tetratricopeptide (TPR) repeat protein